MGCFLVDDYWTPTLQSGPKWAPLLQYSRISCGSQDHCGDFAGLAGVLPRGYVVSRNAGLLFFKIKRAKGLWPTGVLMAIPWRPLEPSVILLLMLLDSESGLG